MTLPDEIPDPRGSHSAPRVVLDADGMDRLELVLGGWLPSSALRAAAGLDARRQAVLTDAENTPLALVVAGPTIHDLPEVRPLAALARGSGAHWDPAVRLSAADVRDRIGARAREALAIDVDLVPTRADEAAAIACATSEDAVVVTVHVGRGTRPAGDVGWAGLTRAAWGLADAIEAARPDRRVVRLVLPSPPERPAEHDRGGIFPLIALSELRGNVAPAPPDLDALVEREAEALYPPASAREILRARRPAHATGAVVFFTGLSGSGKSTIARALADVLADEDGRRVTLLDGDEVRQHLSRGLGFDAASREINIDRIAWVAALVAQHGGIAVAAPIAPFDAGRANARTLAEARGAFLLVHVSTPLEVCEARDRKGMYARARAGEIPEFTGISSPYEPPDDADVTIDATDTPVEESVRRIRAALAALEARLRATSDAGA